MNDDELMGLSLDEARAAIDHDDVPVGALVVIDGTVIARRHNEREATQDPTAHAELLAVRDAARRSAHGGSIGRRSSSPSSRARCAPACSSRPGWPGSSTAPST